MLTITEALAEIKTIDKRVEKKTAFIRRYVARLDKVRDPLAEYGGSWTKIEQEEQAINDLLTRMVVIRTAINSANLTNPIKVGENTRSVAEWIAWRREAAPILHAHLVAMTATIDAVRAEAKQKSQNLVPAATGNADDVVVNVDLMRLAKRVEDYEEVMGTLDGKLSLFNAVTTIKV